MIATFYSFKGGVGRSMALANVAELLASAGYRVLACDWDLEAPGLERYFCEEREQLLEFRKNPGVIDLLVGYKESLTQPTAAKEPSTADDENFRPIGTDGLRVRKPASFAVKILSNQRQSSGWIKLLSAGRRDGEWDAL
jgi:cellulose biosynthesis protein BcsQ